MKKILIGLSILSVLASCKKDPEPSVDFMFSGNESPAPCVVSFINYSTNASSYLWEFGDGSSSTEIDPTHTYATGGTFNVKLSATGKGGSKQISKSITIANPVSLPVSNFTFSGGNQFAPSNIVFNNTSTNATTYLWDFGDGQTSTLQNPNHVYNSGGTFNVSLTSYNLANASNVINKTVVILGKPTKLKIKSIKLTGYPTTTTTGGSWDTWDGPDLFFEINASTNTLISTDYYENVIESNLPLNFSTGFPITITNLSTQHTIDLYDYDTLGSENMGGYYFKPADYMSTDGSAYKTTLTLQSSMSKLKFEIAVEWLQ